MAKFCSNCGTALQEGARFCTSCGQPVAAAAQPAPAAPPAASAAPPSPARAAPTSGGSSFFRTALAWVITFVVAYFAWSIFREVFGPL